MFTSVLHGVSRQNKYMVHYTYVISCHAPTDCGRNTNDQPVKGYPPSSNANQIRYVRERSLWARQLVFRLYITSASFAGRSVGVKPCSPIHLVYTWYLVSPFTLAALSSRCQTMLSYTPGIYLVPGFSVHASGTFKYPSDSSIHP